MTGKLITFEGIDGCGKTTLAKAVYAELSNRFGLTGHEAAYPAPPELVEGRPAGVKERAARIVFTKEPGGTPLGQALRTILQTQKNMVCDLAEYLLFAADRAQHFSQIIMPTLEQGGWVLADRLADSSLAYQGYGRGLAVEQICATNSWAMQGKQPDLTIYVRIDVETAFARIAKRNEALTSFEQEKRAFWQRVLAGYEAIFAQRSNVLAIDGKLVTQSQVACVMQKLEQLQWLS